ncbi:MAG: hypothetical protein V4723_12325 [Pseudomonadota bacterium]
MMRALSACALAALLAACASRPAPPGTQADAARLSQAVVPGQSTRQSVLAALGPTRSVSFDSGYQSWLYQIPLGGASYAEFVILFGPDGIVRKTSRRDPSPFDKPLNSRTP